MTFIGSEPGNGFQVRLCGLSGTCELSYLLVLLHSTRFRFRLPSQPADFIFRAWSSYRDSSEDIVLIIPPIYTCKGGLVKHNLVSEFANNNNSKIYIRKFTKSASISSTMFHDSYPIMINLTYLTITFILYFYQDCKQWYLLPTSFSKITITEEDVYYALINLDTTKAMGPDGIPPMQMCFSAM